jgi:spermidine synthase
MLHTLLPLLFFASGATGLVYEVVWSRALQQLFGISTFAITVVVAAYMAGLALGSARAGRIADQASPAQATRLYGVLEVTIGLFALAFPWLLEGVAWLWRGIGATLVQTPALRAAAEFTLTFLLLLVPTTCMGATLPLVTRALLRHGRTSSTFGAAYAWNTAGAVAGVLLASFLLLGTLGLRHTAYLVAAVNLLLGLVAILAARRAPRSLQVATGEIAAAALAGPRDRRLLLLATLTGFVSLASEIVWIRGFATLFLSTTYTFALVLAVFLVGIAIGAAWGARLPAGRQVLQRVVLGLAAATLMQVLLYGTLHTWTMATITEGSVEHWGLLLLAAAGAAIVVLPLTVMSGAALPLILASLRGAELPGQAGRDVGAAYVCNTVGAVLGCAAAGFLLLPWFGPFTTSRGLALLGVLASLLVVRPGRLASAAGAAVVAAALLLPGPSLSQQALSPVLIAIRAPGVYDRAKSADGEGWEHRTPTLPVQRIHGRACDAALVLDLWSGDRGLWLNGMPNGSSFGDQQTQLGCSALPYLFVPFLDDALHIGLGTGISTGAWAALPGTYRTTVVEIEAGLWDLTRAYEPFAFGLHGNPRVRFVADDARAQLELWPDASLDLVSSEPSQIWTKGVGNLFTSEFFRCVKRKLRDQGVLVTWIMGSGISGEVFAIGVQTLLDEFPHVLAFMGPNRGGDVIFLASKQPLSFQAARFDQLGPVGRALGWTRATDVATYFLADDRTLRAVTAQCLQRGGYDRVRNTDDLPVLEHLYPRYVLGGGRNDLVETLQRTRWQVAGGRDRFVTPPGIGELPLATKFELAVLSGSNALEAVSGLREWSMVSPAAVAAMPADVRAWSFVVAALHDERRTADLLWRHLDGFTCDESFLVHAAVRYLGQRPPRMAAPGPWLRPETLAVLLDLDKEHPGQAYADTFLATIPPERATEVTLPTPYFVRLAEAALACGRAAHVERHVRACRERLGGLHLGYDLALWTLLQARGERSEAARVHAPYAGSPAGARWFVAGVAAGPR